MSFPDSESGASTPDATRVEELFHQASKLHPSEQAAFLERAYGGDQALLAKVSSLLRAGQEAPSVWDRGALDMEARQSAVELPAARPDEFFGPYRIVRFIAAGGMGRVYEALRDDAEFNKRVAIKFVQHGVVGDSDVVERFRRERQILAQLEHPNIARLLDGGSTRDGVPYLVMEYVDGERIDKFVTSRAMTRDKRLKLFVEVCDAVQHAHSNLVVHRDLKPGNILVTSEGSPRLLDFGIAKLLTSEANTTMHALTPEYASPEQLRGGRITTASDTYSLGVLLFVLLTDRLPYRARADQPAELVRAICEEDPAWEPSGLIRGDLRSILTKALDKEPERRYASVDQFAADVRRYVEGLPVQARPPSWWYHAVRFCFRNQALSATLAALVLAIVAGFAVSAWEARRAAQQAQLAERRLADARRLIYSVIHDIQPKLASIDGTVAIRAAMVDQTMGYLEAMGKDAGDSPVLMRELIEGYLELARLTGGGSSANVGDAQRAGQILNKAETLLNTLLRAEPSNSASLRLAVSLYGSAARQEYQYGQQSAGRDFARRGLEAAERLSAATGGDRQSQDLVAQASTALADVLWHQDDESIRLYERSASIWNKALEEHPANSSALRQNVALMYRSMSNAWVRKKNFQRAIDLATKARDIDLDLMEANLGSPAARMNVAFDLGALAYAYDRAQDYKHAVEAQRANVGVREKIVAANPADFRAAERLAYAIQFLAALEESASEHGAAIRDYRRAIDVYAGLHLKGRLLQNSMFTYARSILNLVHLEDRAGVSNDRCGRLKTMLQVLKEYQGRAALNSAAMQELEQMRQEAKSCLP